MKKTKLKKRVKELRTLLLALNTHGSLDLHSYRVIDNQISILFKYKKKQPNKV